MEKIKQIADAADMIINGYAYTRCPQGYRVLNLNRPDRAAVFSDTGKVVDRVWTIAESAYCRRLSEEEPYFMEEELSKYYEYKDCWLLFVLAHPIV